MFKQMPVRLRTLCASPKFFYVTVGFLILQALWIALSSHYPMAFDENFHVGVIKLYAHHLSPFWSGQPADSGTFGAIARDPSYLFQWLMSFPYRFASIFTHHEATLVIWLRLLNIAMMAVSLPLYRRLLLKTGASRAIVHACLFIFVLLPVVPLLAAQVNYDNLLLPLVAWLLLLTLRIRNRLLQRQLPLADLALLLSVGMLTSLVKYAFLPIFAGLLGYTAVVAWRVRGRKTFRRALVVGWRTVSLPARSVLIVLLVVSTGLFLERYGLNMIRYHTPIPDCGDVLTVQECSEFGPWIRDYKLNQQKAGTSVAANPVRYSGDWFYGMWLRTFFAVSGPNDGYQTRSPLPVPALGAVVVAALATYAMVRKFRTVWRRYDKAVLALFITVTVLYVGSLWMSGYKAFRYTGQAVAVNGRYLLPIALFVMLIGALCLYDLLYRHRRLMVGVASVILLTFLWGGGVWTYLVRSNDSWYWHNSVVLNVNHTVKNVLWPITPGKNQSSNFLR